MNYLSKISLLIIGIVLFTNCNNTNSIENSNFKTESSDDEIQNGDIIFQTSQSKQSKAIQIATKSKYSHCGIIYKKGSEFMVFEAVQPVQLTPLQNWISRGENEHYVIKRLKNADKILTNDALKRMKTIGQKFIGKKYDFTFGWTDEKIYCSELVWKIYDRALGVQIGKLEKLGDLDLSNPIVKNVLKNRYGTHIPKKEIVISPESIYESNQLETIKSN